jgi:hypothetical protein
VRGELFRGKFRHSFEKPEPFAPGKVEEIIKATERVYDNAPQSSGLSAYVIPRPTSSEEPSAHKLRVETGDRYDQKGVCG